MKRVGLFAAAIIATCLVLFASCDNGTTDGSVDIEGIWVAAGQDGETGKGKAILFEFSGNEVTRIAYTERFGDEVDPDGPDMYQDEGAKGTYSVSDDILTVTVTQEWANAQWSDHSESRSAEIDLQGTTLTMYLPDIGAVEFEKKSFSQPSALVGTWSEGRTVELVIEAGGTYSYADSGEDYEATGTWSASPDLLRFITTDDSDSTSSFYIENLYEYEITGSNLKTSWNATGTEFSEYTQAD